MYPSIPSKSTVFFSAIAPSVMNKNNDRLPSMGNHTFVMKSLSILEAIDADAIDIASDDDSGINALLTYGLEEQGQNQRFQVDNNGEITTRTELTRSDGNQHRFTINATDNAVPTNTRLSTQASVFVDMIEGKNRFIMVLERDITSVSANKETIRRLLQDYLGKIVLIETINYQRYLDNAGVLNINRAYTDIVFVIVNHDNNFFLYDNTELDLVSLGFGVSQTHLNELRAYLRDYGNVQIIRTMFEGEAIMGVTSELQATISKKTKSYIWWTNDPWAAWIALAGLIILLGLISIIILAFQWT
ncbi:hypothetical protein CHS0354_018059, partial [Potamilus streckersoni]